MTKVFSSHTLKFGGEFRKLFMNFRQHGQPSGSYTFNSSYTQRVIGAAASQTQGNGFSSFLLGIPANGNMEHTFATAAASEYYGFYVQDDWKATRKLTLNIGLRYDIDVPRTERYNRLSYFDIDAPSPIAGRVPGYDNLKGAMRFTSPDHRRQTPTDLNNWGRDSASPISSPRNRYSRSLRPDVLRFGDASSRHVRQFGHRRVHWLDEYDRLEQRREDG